MRKNSIINDKKFYVSYALLNGKSNSEVSKKFDLKKSYLYHVSYAGLTASEDLKKYRISQITHDTFLKAKELAESTAPHFYISKITSLIHSMKIPQYQQSILIVYFVCKLRKIKLPILLKGLDTRFVKSNPTTSLITLTVATTIQGLHKDEFHVLTLKLIADLLKNIKSKSIKIISPSKNVDVLVVKGELEKRAITLAIYFEYDKLDDETLEKIIPYLEKEIGNFNL